ncbi:MAG: multidrug effflux MFS transporter, partial [Pseudomonadales bacterium]
PAIVREFNSTPAQGQLSVSIFMLGFGFGQLCYGPFSDYYGRLPLLKSGLTFYVFASLFCWWAASMEMFLAARLLQGVAAASGPVVARAIVVDIYKRNEAVRVMGYLASAMAIVPAIAPIIGSLLLHWFSWHSHFIALALFASAGLLGVLLVLTETSPSKGQNKPHISTIITQIPHYLMQLQFAGYLLIGSSIFAGMFAYISNSSFLVIELIGVPAEQFGYVFAFVVLGYMAGAYSGARLVSRFGQRDCMRLGLVIALLGASALLAYSVFVAQTTLAFMAPLAMYCFAAGILLPNSQASALTLFPGSAGGASSVYGFASILIGATSGALVGELYNGTALPIAAGVFCGSLMAVLAFTLLIKPKKPDVEQLAET